MSTKTIKQRIAVVAVSALTAGVLSVIAAPVASAATTAPTSNVLHVVINGNYVGGSLATAQYTDAVDNRSSGLLSVGSGTGTTQTAILLSTGALAVVAGAPTGSLVNSIVVTNGTVTKSLSATNTVNYVSNDSSYTVNASPAGTEATNATLGALIKPATGATTMTVQLYSGTGITESLPTNGTLRAQVTVTIATASASGAYAATYSKANTAAITTSGTNTGASAASATVDGVNQSGASTPANGNYGFFNISLKDAYNQTLDTLGAVTIEASNGGLVKYDGTLGTGATPTASLDVTTDASGTISVARPAAQANKGFSTTVTVKYNGVVVATQTFTFYGEVATMVATYTSVARAGTTFGDDGTEAQPFRVVYRDSAGTFLAPTAGDTTVVSSTLTSVVTGAAIYAAPVISTATSAKGQVTCAGSTPGAASSSSTGSADLQLQHVNASGTIIKSNVWKQQCSGDPYTYTAALDKAVYTPGSVATLTITCKDSLGNISSAHPGLGTGGTTNLTISGLGTAVVAPANTDACGDTSFGTKAYQYILGNTESDYAAIVSAGVINSANSSESPKTVSFTIKASGSSVTNAEVLKSIVALIASINKQIQALQKLILRR
jgi:hypothetical protein